MEAEAALGIPYNRMALAGFSQGGAMSIYCGLQLPPEQKPAGLLVMSGYLVGGSSFNLTPGFEDVPVLHCHGSADPVVQYAWAQKTRDHLISLVTSNLE
jgi:predicted esterase